MLENKHIHTRHKNLGGSGTGSYSLRQRLAGGFLPRDFLFQFPGRVASLPPSPVGLWVQSSMLVTLGKTDPMSSQRLARLLSQVPQTLPISERRRRVRDWFCAARRVATVALEPGFQTVLGKGCLWK